MRRQIYIKTNRKQEVIDFYHINPESEITEIVLDNYDIANMLSNQTDISKDFFENILNYSYNGYFTPETNDDLYQELSIESEALLKKYAKQMFDFDEEFDQDVFERLLDFDEELMDMVYDAYDDAQMARTSNRIIEELKDSLNEATQKLLEDNDLLIRNLQASYEYSPKYNKVVASFKTTPLIDLLVNDVDDKYDFSTIEEMAIDILSNVLIFTEPYNGFEDFYSDLYNDEIQRYVASKIDIELN